MKEKESNQQIFRFSSREEYLKALDNKMPEDYYNFREIPNQAPQPYLPVPIQQALADDLFHYWNVTDERYIVIANELVCTVRLTYMPSYPDAEELYCTGTAAGAIQMGQGAKVGDFPLKKKINALEYNLPAKRSAAIGCALETLGNIFGRNLGRKISKDKLLAADFTIRQLDAETK
jgi:hypothetical protein